MAVRRKPKAKILVPLAAMGDIAFLLLIFFMVASNFKQAEAKLEPASSATIEETERPQVIVNVDEEGKVWVQGVETTVGALAYSLEQLIDTRTEVPKFHLMIHKELEKKDFHPVIEAFAEAGVYPILTGQRAEP